MEVRAGAGRLPDRAQTAGGPGKSANLQENELFHSLSAMLQFPLVTADGEKRPIQGVLFDDRSWLIRYLVIVGGNWLAPRPVVVSTSAVEVSDWTMKHTRTQLTLQQVLSSPPAETVRPVSRQQELAWSRHFGWPQEEARWHMPAIAARREFEGSGEDDPHLRRAGDLKGYEVWGVEGSIGQLKSYLVQDRSWHIGYLAVRARDWVHGEQVIPTQRVCEVSWGEHRVWLEGAVGAPRDCEGDRPDRPAAA
jgi:hypothetical protein